MDLAHDEAHQQTEKDLARLERRVRKVYSEAQKDLDKKIADFNRRFKEKDKIHQKELKNGKITEDQYKRWLSGQVFQGKQWQSKRDQMTTTLVHADKVAQQIINGQVYGVFANNANWQSYLLEHEAGLNFGFELYDASTVERLLRDNPKVLPKYRLDIPKDQRWNQSLITRQITQGIIQGERLDQIAKRLEKVTDHDRNLCLTRARTAMTGAQNAGRQESMTRATGMGIKVKKEWLATLDHHTRTSHAKLDGVSVPINKKFHGELGEIEYPGDPHAPAGEVYNCRCTMIADLVDYPDTDADGVQRYDNIDGKPIKDMSYSQWKSYKEAGKPIPAVEKAVETVEKKMKKAVFNMAAFKEHAEYYVGGGYDIDDVFSQPDLKYIADNMETTKKPLYRIENSRFTADLLDTDRLDSDDFQFKGSFRSFSRGQSVIQSYIDEMDDEGLVVFETVGPVKHFNMDKYAEAYMDNQEESLVGGHFKIVGEDMKMINGAFVRIIKISQIKK